MKIDGLYVDEDYLKAVMTGRSVMCVPIYQRDYDWGPEDVDNLLELFLESAAESDSPIFLGNLVFHSDGERGEATWYLVDGQQRIATTSLILGSVLHKLRESSHSMASTSAAEYTKVLTTATGILDPETPLDPAKIRLRMSDKDHARYRDFVQFGEDIDGRTKLGKAQRRIRKRIDEVAPDDESLYALARAVFDALEKVVCVTSIEVSDPIDPLAVFESLNSKGVGLSESDLLKNYVMQKTPKEVQKDALVRWRSIEQNVDEKMVGFLRTWHLASEGMVRKNALYRRFKDLLKEEAVGSLLSKLEKWSQSFHDLASVSPKRFRQDETRRRLREFNALGFQQAVPVLLSAVHAQASEKQLRDLLTWMECAYVRLFRTRQIRGSIVENEFISLCGHYRDSIETGLAATKKTIRKLCEAHCPTMEYEWERLDIAQTADQSFILRRLEQAAQGNPAWVPSSTTVIEIEHIIPQTLDSDLDYGLKAEDHERLLNRIGNLCLVLESHNPRLGNLLFNNKKEVYRWYDGSRHKDDPVGGSRRHDLTAALANNSASTWGPKEVAARGAELGRLADRTWPIP